MTRAKLAGVIPRALRLARPRPDPGAAYAVPLDAVADAGSEFDVIHCHVDWVHLPLLARLDRPFLTTLHGRLDLPGLRDVVRRFPEAAFVSISDSQRLALPTAHWLGTVYHGCPGRASAQPPAQGYLAFLGRITRERSGRRRQLARAAGLPLRMAAKIPRADNRYYKEHLEPLIDGEQIRLLGEVDDRGKGELLRSAAALLFPIDWPEPFGLVMIEAMACGTPVIAFRRGSVPSDRRRRLGLHRRQRGRSARGHQAHWHARQTHRSGRIRTAIYGAAHGRRLPSALSGPRNRSSTTRRPDQAQSSPDLLPITPSRSGSEPRARG